MRNLILMLAIILFVLVVITAMMRSNKQNSTASAFAGGTNRLFGKQKTHGFEAVVQRLTAVLDAIWMILLFVLAFLSSK